MDLGPLRIHSLELAWYHVIIFEKSAEASIEIACRLKADVVVISRPPNNIVVERLEAHSSRF